MGNKRNRFELDDLIPTQSNSPQNRDTTGRFLAGHKAATPAGVQWASTATSTQEVTRSTICLEIEAIVAKLLQRTIRKPLVTSGAGFNGYQYGMNSGNGLSDCV
jgi:hypothetical protein